MTRSSAQAGRDGALDPLRQEMRAYYDALRYDRFEQNPGAVRRRDEIRQAMDRFAAANPHAAAWTLKAQLHHEIAERFEPVLFPHSPFFREMGLRPSENWGTLAKNHVANWVHAKRRALVEDHPRARNVRALGFDNGGLAIAHPSIFDSDHHCLGYTRLLRLGIDGIEVRPWAEIDNRTGLEIAWE
jgi:hypothetical protein